MNHTKNAFITLEKLWRAAREDPQGGIQHTALEPALLALWKALPWAVRSDISGDRVRNAEESYRTTLTIWHSGDPLEDTPEELGRAILQGNVHLERLVTETFTQAAARATLGEPTKE